MIIDLITLNCRANMQTLRIKQKQVHSMRWIKNENATNIYAIIKKSRPKM